VWAWYPLLEEVNGVPAAYLPPGWEASDQVMGAALGTGSLTCHAESVPAIAGHFPVLLFAA